VSRHAADEEAVAGALDGNLVVAGGVRRDRRGVGAAVVVGLLHLQHVVDALGVLELCTRPCRVDAVITIRRIQNGTRAKRCSFCKIFLRRNDHTKEPVTAEEPRARKEPPLCFFFVRMKQNVQPKVRVSEHF
jgi:hypothetical protein